MSSAYETIDAKSTGRELVAFEEEKIGLSHTEAGYAVADHWDFPDEITTLIRYHHAPERATGMQPEVCIACLATFLSEAHYRGDDLSVEEAFDDAQYAIDQLKISPEQILQVYAEVAADFSV